MPTGEVTGKVTMAGQPLGEGTVVFFSKPGVPAATGPIGAGGEFRLETPVPAGDYKVAIQPLSGAAPTPESVGAKESPKVEIPPKYLSETTSELTASVKEGPNTVAFELK
ncbi:MAG: hypothetical protein HUU20_02185 [Pirellulales bacterium]|nr:hypothetical protein [Pirellulales bacterium]